MSETITEAVKAFTATLASAVTTAATAWVKAEDGVTKSRVKFGRAVGRAKAAIIAAGGTDEDAEALIWPTVFEVTGSRVEWKTVLEWVRAASVADSLDPEVAAIFSTEALKTIGRVPVKVSDEEKSAGKMTRSEFAELAKETGVTSVRDLREAVKAERSTGDTKKKTATAAAQSEETVTALKGLVSDETAARISDIGTEEKIALVMLGVMLRDKVTKHQIAAVTEGVTEYFTPTPEASDDGSGAPDTEPEA